MPSQVPGIGGPITVEAVIYGADVALGLAAAVLAVAPLTRVIHPHDLIDAFPRALQRTAALTGAALNLVPAVARNAVAISEAQRMRGRRGTRVRDWHAVAAPDHPQRARRLAAAGGGDGVAGLRLGTAHTVRDQPPRRARRSPSSRAAVAAVVLTVVARATGALPDWYPFPVATLPDVTLLPVIACALLALPLLAWRRS